MLHFLEKKGGGKYPPPPLATPLHSVQVNTIIITLLFFYIYESMSGRYLVIMLICASERAEATDQLDSLLQLDATLGAIKL